MSGGGALRRDWTVGSRLRLGTKVSPRGFLRFNLSGNRLRTGHEADSLSRKNAKSFEWVQKG